MVLVCISPSGAFDERPDVSSCEISHELRSATDGPPPLTRAAHRLSDAQSVPAAPGASTSPARDAAAGGGHISNSHVDTIIDHHVNKKSKRTLFTLIHIPGFILNKLLYKLFLSSVI